MIWGDSSPVCTLLLDAIIKARKAAEPKKKANATKKPAAKAAAAGGAAAVSTIFYCALKIG